MKFIFFALILPYSIFATEICGKVKSVKLISSGEGIDAVFESGATLRLLSQGSIGRQYNIPATTNILSIAFAQNIPVCIDRDERTVALKK